ncbi:MAG: phosphate acyltransferase [Lachnospirales bacterium]
MYKSYSDLIEKRYTGNKTVKKAVVAGANESHVLEAVFLAAEKGYVYPILVGVEDKIKEVINSHEMPKVEYEIVPCDEETNPAEIAVKLIKEGKGDFIVKGKIETKNLLRPILNKETGLNSNGFITHFGLMEIESYHKLLVLSDCAVIPYPKYDDKIKIIKACTEALRKLGYEKPVVGALCAAEAVSDKMPETIEAKALEEASQKGELGECVVVGPISYDLATSKESAKIKGYESPYAGDVDMLLMPQMVTGNVMSKILNTNPKNILAGCLVGADIPIVLTSRSASMEEKLHSIILCNLLS